MKQFFSSRKLGGRNRASLFGLTMACIAYGLAGIAFLSALVNLWPVVDPPLSGATAAPAPSAMANIHRVDLLWGLYVAHLGKPSGLLILAMIMGALGAYTGTLVSLVGKARQDRLYSADGWWLVLQPMVGATIGVMLYFAFRAGFVNPSGGSNGAATIDPYGVALVAGVAGLFSRQALRMLEKVLGTETASSANRRPAQRATTPTTGKGGA